MSRQVPHAANRVAPGKLGKERERVRTCCRPTLTPVRPPSFNVSIQVIKRAACNAGAQPQSTPANIVRSQSEKQDRHVEPYVRSDGKSERGIKATMTCSRAHASRTPSAPHNRAAIGWGWGGGGGGGVGGGWGQALRQNWLNMARAVAPSYLAPRPLFGATVPPGGPPRGGQQQVWQRSRPQSTHEAHPPSSIQRARRWSLLKFVLQRLDCALHPWVGFRVDRPDVMGHRDSISAVALATVPPAFNRALPEANGIMVICLRSES